MGLTDDHEGSGTAEEPGNRSRSGASGPGAPAAPASSGTPAAADTAKNRHEIKIALIAGMAGVVTALIGGVASVLTGLIQVSAGESGPPPAAPAVTVTAQQGSSAPAAPGPASRSPAAPALRRTSPSATAAAHAPAYVTDLNRKGDNWSQGTWGLGGKRYPHSLAWTDPCNNDDSEMVTVELDGAYQRFTATVGVDDNGGGDRFANAGFEVYADLDGDGTGESDELVASSGAVQGRPGHIDAAIKGAPRIFLVVKASTGDCLLDPAVWGDARVS